MMEFVGDVATPGREIWQVDVRLRGGKEAIWYIHPPHHHVYGQLLCQMEWWHPGHKVVETGSNPLFAEPKNCMQT